MKILIAIILPSFFATSFSHANTCEQLFLKSQNIVLSAPTQSENAITLSPQDRARSQVDLYKTFLFGGKRGADSFLSFALAETNQFLSQAGRITRAENIGAFNPGADQAFNQTKSLISDTANLVNSLQHPEKMPKQSWSLRSLNPFSKNSEPSQKQIIDQIVKNLSSLYKALEVLEKENTEIEAEEYRAFVLLEKFKQEQSYITSLVQLVSAIRNNPSYAEAAKSMDVHIDFELGQVSQDIGLNLAHLSNVQAKSDLRRSEVMTLKSGLRSLQAKLPLIGENIPALKVALDQFEKDLAERAAAEKAQADKLERIKAKNAPRKLEVARLRVVKAKEAAKQIRIEKQKVELRKAKIGEAIDFAIRNGDEVSVSHQGEVVKATLVSYDPKDQKKVIVHTAEENFSVLLSDIAINDLKNTKDFSNFESGNTVANGEVMGFVVGFFSDGRVLVKTTDSTPDGDQFKALSEKELTVARIPQPKFKLNDLQKMNPWKDANWEASYERQAYDPMTNSYYVSVTIMNKGKQVIQSKTWMTPEDLQNQIKEEILTLREELKEGQRGIIVRAYKGKIDGSKLVMHKFKAGTFKMGENQVETTITKDYELSATQTTQKIWSDLMLLANRYGGYAHKVEIQPSRFKGDLKPVETVSYEDVMNWLKMLNNLSSNSHPKIQKELQELIPGHRKGDVYDLPTEAQWEFVMRNRGKSNKEHFDRDDQSKVGSYAWICENSGDETHPVASLKPRMIDNGYGKLIPMYDMEGNVWEWTRDWYDSPLAGGKDPQGPSSGSYRVLRGGSWHGSALLSRSGYRIFLSPGFRCGYIGFRLVRTRP